MNAPQRLAVSVRAADLRDPSEVARVDGFVCGQAAATPFHRPAWTAAVERGAGARAHYLLAEQGGALRGVLPLSEIRSPLFGAALVSAGFGVDGGVLAESPAAAEALASAAIALAGRRRCPGIELRGGALPSGWRTSEGAHAGFVRDLPEGDEAILKAIPRKQRAEVRKGLAGGLDLRADRDPADHYLVYAESVRNLGSPVFPRRLLAAVLEAFGPDADVLTVRHGGRPVASVLSLYFRETVFPYWGGGTAAARALRANELLYYALMCHARRRGCSRFDFGRSKVGSGAYSFKKNWGFEPRPLVYAHWGEARDVNPASPRYRAQVALWRKLPLWLANLAGPPIARGLG